MKYYSYILEFPSTPPFDREEYRWPSFIAEFVAPLVRRRDPNHFLYWCSYYGATANFRIYTDQYEDVRGSLEAALIDLKLRDTGAEKDETLVNDLAKSRFIGPDTKSNPQHRAELILQSLHSVCNLLIDSVVPVAGRYWQFEANGDTDQNPIGNHLFSVMHLYHNITRSQARIAVYKSQEKIDLLSYYYFHYAKVKALYEILPKDHQLIRECSVDV
jgi:hypothetical protein